MKYSNRKFNQEGAALFVSMTMLLLVTIIVLTATRTSNLELIMGVNTQNAAESLMRAESSTVEGEDRIFVDFSGAPSFDFSQIETDGLYLDAEIDMDTVDWMGMNYEMFYIANGDSTRIETSGVAFIPGDYNSIANDIREYMLEYIGSVPLAGGSLAAGAGGAMGKRYLYRVSGRGTGNRRSARVVQTIFATVE
jgi:Tfp pilus assembly protein PilX